MRAAEGAVVNCLLGGEREMWVREELEREIGGDANDIADALGALERCGVVVLCGGLVTLSRAARRTDELAL